MYYPFPVDAEHPYPEEIQVEGAEFRRKPEGIVWRLQFAPGETRQVTVRYVQRCLEPEARYILTSTGRWGEPLARARFELSWPEGLQGVQSTYPGERRVSDGRVRVSVERREFLPEEDLVLRWTR